MSWRDGLELTRVINASGKMTHLGGTAVTADVAGSMAEAAQDYFDMEELIVESGKKIAALVGAEAACPTVGAAAGIALSVASCMTGTEEALIKKLPVTEGLRNRVIIQKGHAVDFGAPVTQMIRIPGGIPVEVGCANMVTRADVEEAIDEDTAALIYVKSHHCVQKGMLSVEEYVEIAHAHGLPVIVDAAAEEDLHKYIDLGADLVVYSGAKAVGGPTSGFVCGKKGLIDGVRLQYRGIGRSMKVGKEAIAGLLCALEKYVAGNVDALSEREAVVETIMRGISGIRGIKVSKKYDEAGRPIPRVWMEFTEDARISAREFVSQLRQGSVAIFTRDHYLNLNCVAIDPRPLRPQDSEIIIKRIRELLEG
ncbi:MAG: DgaE family pyridoxal phosphate-dependent ammonia lyase [Candidatus Fermentithermobacillus carboniphilus]|uniref:DgaE family pyridoxal phosphate-dependent ammonia lyase n=1 Tax=Candidatus Fermentithermobacillus carboniphilus TaxID=3085328 RepID=A0AAT9LDS9_9FIRM|nr:MAG: DgaE family pyridoxal phosphate-dependent ammonia lyase [Candidatus Fermentithermobacillus carboniphilus]